MSRGTRLLSLAVAIGVAGVATGVSSANGGRGVAAVDPSTPKLALGVAVFPIGKIEGIVSAVQRGKRRRARLAVSLHGLEPGMSYRVVGSRQRCSRGAEASKEGDVPFSLNFEEVRSRGDVILEDIVVVFRTPLVAMNGSLRKVRSVRIYEVAAGTSTRVRVACTAFTQSTTSGASRPG